MDSHRNHVGNNVRGVRIEVLHVDSTGCNRSEFYIKPCLPLIDPGGGGPTRGGGGGGLTWEQQAVPGRQAVATHPSVLQRQLGEVLRRLREEPLLAPDVLSLDTFAWRWGSWSMG